MFIYGFVPPLPKFWCLCVCLCVCCGEIYLFGPSQTNDKIAFASHRCAHCEGFRMNACVCVCVHGIAIEILQLLTDGHKRTYHPT